MTDKDQEKQRCEQWGISLDEYREKQCGDFTVEDMEKAYKRGKQKDWHYPSKGEFPNEAEVRNCEIIENILICTKRIQLRAGFYRRGEFCVCNGANLPPDLVFAWQYLPEPPEEN